MAKRKGKSKGTVTVDMSDVTSGGGGTVTQEGDYTVEVEACKQETGKDSGQPYLVWEFRVTEGKFKGKKLYHNTSLQPQALFNLRNLLEAMGVDVPDSEMDLNLSDFVGETLGVTVELEEYLGKDKPRIINFFQEGETSNAGDDDDSDDDDSDDDDDDSDDDDSDDDDDDSDDDDSDDDDDDDNGKSDDDDDDDDEPVKAKRQKKSKEKPVKGKVKPSKKGKKKR